MQPVFDLGTLVTDEDFIYGVSTVIKVQKEHGQSKASILEGLCELTSMLGMDYNDFCSIIDKPDIKDVIDNENDDFDLSSADDKHKRGCDSYDCDTSYIESLGSFGLFLRDIANIPLLTQEEEIKYGKMVKSSNKKVRKLGRDALVEHNMRLVVHLAKRKKVKSSTIDINDLVAAGSIGLIKAAEKYDCFKGTRFGTYATWWITQTINTCINNEARTIRVSVNNLTALSRVTRFRENYVNSQGKEPSVGEIAAALKMNVRKVSDLLVKTQQVVSLDEWLDQDDDKASALETIADPNGVDPLIEAMKSDFSSRIDEVLLTLPTREYLMVKSYFGFDCKRENIKEIATRYHVREEDAKKTVAGAMKKLRSKARKEELSKLLPYLEI